jgi:thiamine transporter
MKIMQMPRRKTGGIFLCGSKSKEVIQLSQTNGNSVQPVPATRRLVEAGVFIALATVLSVIKLYQMPMGGSVTLVSMLPILIFGYRNGFKWGLGTAFAYGVIQLLLDIGVVVSWGLTAQALAASFILDYLTAFTALGLAGLFGKGFWKFITGSLFAVSLRFASHVIAGVVAYSSFMPEEWGSPWIYSLAYNGSFLLPDFAICIAVGSLIYIPLKKFLEVKA